jgi:ketosteroid isomerase-like protein
MRAKSSLRFTLIAVGLLATLGVVFYPTDEKRVKQAAEALIAAVNADDAQLSRALQTYATAEVSISVAELPDPVTGRDAVLAAVRAAHGLGQKLHFTVEAVEVSVEGKHARLNADLITSLRPELPELRRPRPSVALFEKSGDHFRLVSAEIGPEPRDQPEARP